MDKRKIHIDEFFDRQMGNHTETPPPAVWDALEKRLDNKPGRKRPVAIWWFWGIAGLIMISASVIIAGYLYNSNTMIAETKATQPQFAAITSTPDVNEVPATVQQGSGSTQSINTNNTPSTAEQLSTSASPTTNTPKTNSLSTTNTSKHTAPANSGNLSNTYNIPNHKNNTTRGEQLQAKQNEHKVDMQQQAVGTKAAPVVANVIIPAQQVDMPVVAAAKDEDNTDENNSSRPVNKVSRIPVSDLLASINPISPSDVLSKMPLQNLPNAEVSDIPAIEPEALSEQYAYTDTTKRNKLSNNTDTTAALLDATVYPVVTKKKKPLPFDFGIKAGYALGFNQSWRANKFAIAPYLEYRLPSKISLILQPTFHIGKAKLGTFPNSMHDFHEIQSSSFDSSSRLVRGVIDGSVITPNPPDTIFRTYKYGQVYDSIHVGYNVTNKQMWDVELPVMVKYKVSKTFAFILGGSVTYSSVLQTKEEMTRYSGLTQQYSEDIDPATFYTTYQGQKAPDGPAPKSFSDLFSYNTDEFTGYTPRTESTNKNFFRYGFMLGASATFSERLMIDVMLHKTGVDVNAVPDKELQKVYNQPYLRVMLGYKFSK